MAPQPPPLGWVRITAADPPLEVVARLAEEPAIFTAGFGGWNAVERPRRPPITTFTAPPGREMQLAILLDEWSSGRSIEAELDQVRKMGRPTSSDGEPPQLTIAALGNAVPGQALTWVVSDLAWGDALANENGDRVRQQVTLTLLEYVEDVYLAERSAANRRRKKRQLAKKRRGAKAKRVRAKRGRRRPGATARTVSLAEADAAPAPDGEDLLSLAARELGDADRWVEIAELNGLRDPRAIVVGQELRLP